MGVAAIGVSFLGVPSVAGGALSGVAAAIRILYGVAASVDEFFERHIAELKASDQPSVQATGRFLEGARAGLKFGYVACAAITVVGQLILGHPVLAGLTAVKSILLINPVAVTCGAVGAIVYGWGALSQEERAAIIDRARCVLDIAADAVKQCIDFLMAAIGQVVDSKFLLQLKEYVKTQSEEFGRSLGEITRSVKDKAADAVGRKPTPRLQQADDAALADVLRQMDAEEMQEILKYPFGVAQPVSRGAAALRQRVITEFAAAGSYSLPFAEHPSYGQILVLVARRLDLPVPLDADADEIERAILFKVMERSIERMDQQTQDELLKQVQQELESRGVKGTVSLNELVRFVKFAGMDVGGTFGTLMMTAPGLAGMAGLNFLQFAVLKGLILSSGYLAAGGAVLGIGTGGALMAVAGAAGPIAIALGVLYTGYRVSGPAFRKLVPGVCAIAAKRIEVLARPRG